MRAGDQLVPCKPRPGPKPGRNKGERRHLKELGLKVRVIAWNDFDEPSAIEIV